MPASTPPLLAHLRRRLHAFAWLFAFLVVAKSVFAIACAGDGPQSGADSATVVVTAAATHADEGGCWHAGAAGCHCACAHAATLVADAAFATLAAPRTAVRSALAPAAVPAPREPALRPPIA